MSAGAAALRELVPGATADELAAAEWMSPAQVRAAVQALAQARVPTPTVLERWGVMYVPEYGAWAVYKGKGRWSWGGSALAALLMAAAWRVHAETDEVRTGAGPR